MSVEERRREQARAWAAGDPDPDTRAQVRRWIDADDQGALAAAFDQPLAFGTAGLRGPVGAGPARMSRATVLRTTWGLAAHLCTQAPRPLVVVGGDARPDSPRFVTDVVAALTGAGARVQAFRRPVPTPLVAHAAKRAGADAAVVVTASHNPPDDNGYKVYGPGGQQIAPPVDARIAERIEAAPAAADVPTSDAEPAWLDDDAEEAYLAALAELLPPAPGPGVRVAYTPLHGVAGGLATRALTAAGHEVRVVAGQAEPDGTFPTIAKPNPEEPGTLDALLALAAEADAELALANDPDGDRLAVAVPGPGGWRTLTGNEVAALLADDLLARWSQPAAVVVTTAVTSPMVAEVARRRGAGHEETLTGFKWICLAMRGLAAQGAAPVLGAEEALGYAIDDLVRDKDGVSAAVAVADLARRCRSAGEGLLDRLGRLEAEVGRWRSAPRRIALAGAGPEAARTALAGLVAEPPTRLAGVEVTAVVDHREADPSAPAWRPPSDMVTLGLAAGRAVVRPSGTEPLLKAYVDVVDEQGGLAAAVADELVGRLGIG